MNFRPAGYLTCSIHGQTLLFCHILVVFFMTNASVKFRLFWIFWCKVLTFTRFTNFHSSSFCNRTFTSLYPRHVSYSFANGDFLPSTQRGLSHFIFRLCRVCLSYMRFSHVSYNSVSLLLSHLRPVLVFSLSNTTSCWCVYKRTSFTTGCSVGQFCTTTTVPVNPVSFTFRSITCNSFKFQNFGTVPIFNTFSYPSTFVCFYLIFNRFLDMLIQTSLSRNARLTNIAYLLNWIGL